MPQRHPRPEHPIKSSVWCNLALSCYFQLFQGWQAITCFITSLYAPFFTSLHFPEVPTKTTKSLGQLLCFPYSLPVTIFEPPGGFQPCLTQGPISYKATLVRPKKPCDSHQIETKTDSTSLRPITEHFQILQDMIKARGRTASHQRVFA